MKNSVPRLKEAGSEPVQQELRFSKTCGQKYINLNNKTQIITPSQLGEIVYDVVDNSIKRLLDPRLTASWEKGLTGVAEGNISTDEYLLKLEAFISKNTMMVKTLNNEYSLRQYFNRTTEYYKNRRPMLCVE